jgi:hypothetical protein
VRTTGNNSSIKALFRGALTETISSRSHPQQSSKAGFLFIYGGNMITRVTALLTDDTLVEGWARNFDEWREKLSILDEYTDDAFVYLYGCEPHNLTWEQVNWLKQKGFDDDYIKRICDVLPSAATGDDGKE